MTETNDSVVLDNGCNDFSTFFFCAPISDWIFSVIGSSSVSSSGSGDFCGSGNEIRQHSGACSISHSHGLESFINPIFSVQLHTCLPAGLEGFQNEVLKYTRNNQSFLKLAFVRKEQYPSQTFRWTGA